MRFAVAAPTAPGRTTNRRRATGRAAVVAYTCLVASIRMTPPNRGSIRAPTRSTGSDSGIQARLRIGGMYKARRMSPGSNCVSRSKRCNCALENGLP